MSRRVVQLVSQKQNTSTAIRNSTMACQELDRADQELGMEGLGEGEQRHNRFKTESSTLKL